MAAIVHPALGIDYGAVRVGVAVTDACGILAYPVESIIVARVDPLARLVQLSKDFGVKVLVLGLPLRADGSEGRACEKVRAFGEQLRARLPQLPLVYADEFCTTMAAHEKLHAAGKREKNMRAIIDQAAAVEILTGWMQNGITQL